MKHIKSFENVDDMAKSNLVENSDENTKIINALKMCGNLGAAHVTAFVNNEEDILATAHGNITNLTRIIANIIAQNPTLFMAMTSVFERTSFLMDSLVKDGLIDNTGNHETIKGTIIEVMNAFVRHVEQLGFSTMVNRRLFDLLTDIAERDFESKSNSNEDPDESPDENTN